MRIAPRPSILIIRLSALGDILHTLPALAALRRAMPEARIGWLVQDAGAPLLEGHPMIDRLHVWPRRALRRESAWAKARAILRVAAELRAEGYETAIDFQGLTKSAVWAGVCGAKQRIGFGGEDAREISGFFYNRKVSFRPDRFHVIERNLTLLEPLGVTTPDVEFPVHFPVAVRSKAEEIWGGQAPGPPRVILNPGAGWVTKQWPAANYGELAAALVEKFGARVALAWGPGEEPLVQEALAAAGCDAGAPSAATVGDLQKVQYIPQSSGVHPLPPTSFVELGAVISHADLYVGGDTGPTHFAAALGVPVVGLYGASDPKRNGPWGQMDRVIQLDAPACVPCWKTRCAHEPKFACLTGIDVARVISACERILPAHHLGS